jgi:hypothetical protein
MTCSLRSKYIYIYTNLQKYPTALRTFRSQRQKTQDEAVVNDAHLTGSLYKKTTDLCLDGGRRMAI